jgi:hypothetical protein
MEDQTIIDKRWQYFKEYNEKNKDKWKEYLKNWRNSHSEYFRNYYSLKHAPKTECEHCTKSYSQGYIKRHKCKSA